MNHSSGQCKIRHIHKGNTYFLSTLTAPWTRERRPVLPTPKEGREVGGDRMQVPSIPAHRTEPCCSCNKCASRANPKPPSFCFRGQWLDQKILGIAGEEKRRLAGKRVLRAHSFYAPAEEKRPMWKPVLGLPNQLNTREREKKGRNSK